MAISRKIIRGILALRERGFDPVGILDIGSYIGEFSLNMRNNFKQPHIVMVDALEEHSKVCTHIADRIGNAEFKLAVVGDEDKPQCDFWMVDNTTNPNLNLSGSSLYREDNNFPIISRKLPMTTVETLLKDDTHKYDLVKLSAPGAEVDVLSGFGQRINDVQVLLTKVNLLDYNVGAPRAGEVINKIENMGFRLTDIVEEHRMGTPDLFQVDCVFVRSGSSLRLHGPFFSA